MMTSSAVATPLDLDLLRELGDLKRIRSAQASGSIAERLFLQAWAALQNGLPTTEVCFAIVRAALSATRLGDIDAGLLTRLGLSGWEAAEILRRALDEAGSDLDAGLRAALVSAVSLPDTTSPTLSFALRLTRQPRAGVTCPGKPRVMLEPPENHAEHCLVVAVYGVVLAARYGAKPETVFLASLAHHLHNAEIPDSGFAGEVLLGGHLDSLFDMATRNALAELPPVLAAHVEAARKILPDAETPEGQAFHAADTLDRVLEIEQHLRAGRTTMHQVLHEMRLVHEGAVKSFQDALLTEAGLQS
ncbi:hypothetical protein [Teichococcus vastitatis]|uniref:hypothetical protein n=1 Tax=Teichococcus vastitatis TaxID=2307076 RepID=UPI00192E70B4|nr:hypothetical protein [Pseudoroseomonas vastitatis]